MPLSNPVESSVSRDCLETAGKSMENALALRIRAHAPPGNLASHALSIARQAALAAGSIQMAQFANSRHRVLDTAAHDIKLEVDQQCETAICSLIHKAFPGHAILSEECGAKGDPGAEYLWIVDPLDGTVNYFQGLPYFCTCIACYRLETSDCNPCNTASLAWLEAARPVAGVVFAPALKHMYCAVAGSGATCNGHRLQTPDIVRLADALVGVSFGSQDHTINTMGRLITRLARQVRKVRILGATGLDIAGVATGSLHGLIQPRVRLWDFAASQIILEESGGRFAFWPSHEGGWRIMAATPRLDTPLREMMNSIFPSPAGSLD